MKNGKVYETVQPDRSQSMLFTTQVVAVPKPLAEDPQITVGALRWVLDQAVQPDDVVHIVHIVNCLVQKLEVYHGAHSSVRASSVASSISCTAHSMCLASCNVNSSLKGDIACVGVPGTSFSFQDPGGIHHEHEDIARAKAFLAKS